MLNETFKNGTPEMKYYAFDWDDNIVHMPTKIILKNEDGEEVGMSTEDFANYRHEIGKNPFMYEGEKIVGFSDLPFRNFKEQGDKQFLVDVMRAKPGPAFDDFKEAINNGSVFAIITARGHNPQTLKQAVYNYIVSNYEGIDKSQLIKNLKKYREFADEEELSDDELIKSYLELNKYHPVSYGDTGNAVNPEEAKVMAMDEFVDYVRGLSALLNKKAYIKNDVSNTFVPKQPTIGFSDDDLKNIEVIKKHFEDKKGNKVKTYLTKGGIKKEF